MGGFLFGNLECRSSVATNEPGLGLRGSVLEAICIEEDSDNETSTQVVMISIIPKGSVYTDLVERGIEEHSILLGHIIHRKVCRLGGTKVQSSCRWPDQCAKVFMFGSTIHRRSNMMSLATTAGDN